MYYHRIWTINRTETCPQAIAETHHFDLSQFQKEPIPFSNGNIQLTKHPEIVDKISLGWSGTHKTPSSSVKTTHQDISVSSPPSAIHFCNGRCRSWKTKCSQWCRAWGGICAGCVWPGDELSKIKLCSFTKLRVPGACAWLCWACASEFLCPRRYFGGYALQIRVHQAGYQWNHSSVIMLLLGTLIPE